MGKETGISWTDHTFNPWWGCTKVSPGCDNCYAETLDKRMFPVQIMPESHEQRAAHWGSHAERRTFSDKHWAEPLAWNAQAKKEGFNHLVFCASMADVFEEQAPYPEQWRLWNLIQATPNLTWQLLTKRPHLIQKHLPLVFIGAKNTWLGTTAENQQYYDHRWPQLQAACSKYKLPSFISYEPALGPLMIGNRPAPRPDWIIFGGETGAGRRGANNELQIWAENLRDECSAFGVAFYVKQLSASTPTKAKELIPPTLQIHQFPRWFARKEA